MVSTPSPRAANATGRFPLCGLALLFLVSSAAGLELHVAPGGNDARSGRLPRASASAPVSYEAAPGARPVFSGGRTIGGWKRGSDGVWFARVPEVAAGAWYFEQLWVNGHRATRARTPNQFWFYFRDVTEEKLPGDTSPASADDDREASVNQRHPNRKPLSPAPEWAGMGHELGSVIADPLFADPAKRDYWLRPGSPALKTGFRPFDFSQAGVRGPAAWRRLAESKSYPPVETPPPRSEP